MDRHFILLCVVLITYPTLSSQSPQSSFFGWPFESDNAVPKMASESPTNITPSPKLPITEQTAGVKLTSPEQQPATIQQELVSPQPSQNVTTTSSAFNINNSSSPNNTSIPPKQNSTLTNYFGAEINYYVTTSVVFLGAALGREGCDLKAACLMGRFIPPIQGRDIAMVAAEQLVPEEGRWKAIYQAAKSSMIQGQDCSQFTCV